MLRLLPLIVGNRIPESEPTWLVLLNLKDIVELVLSSVHTDVTICFLESKISEHRHRFLDAFPQEILFPKHHFLEHYPQLLYGSTIVQPSLQVTKLSTVDLTVLREDIKKALEAKFPGDLAVQMANTVRYSGTSCSTGMILAHGSTGGLPDFVELILIVVVNGKIGFIVKCLYAWCIEHLRSYNLENARSVKVIEPGELSDIVPMAAYTVAGKRMVTQKRYIYLP